METSHNTLDKKLMPAAFSSIREVCHFGSPSSRASRDVRIALALFFANGRCYSKQQQRLGQRGSVFKAKFTLKLVVNWEQRRSLQQLTLSFVACRALTGAAVVGRPRAACSGCLRGISALWTES